MDLEEVVSENIDLSMVFQDPQKFKEEWIGEKLWMDDEYVYFAIVEWENAETSMEKAANFKELKEMSENLETIRGVKHYIPVIAKKINKIEFVKIG